MSNDVRFLASQAFAIAEALQTDEDRLIWTASTSLGQMIISQPQNFAEMLPIFQEYQNDLFTQTFLGKVSLSLEFRAFIQHWVNLCYTPDIMAQQRSNLDTLLDFIEN